MESAPWIADLHLGAFDLGKILRWDSPWLKHIDQCWHDKITIEEHPLLPHERLFVRRIELAYRHDRGTREWAARFAIWHRDAQWLADLPYSQMRTLFQPDFFQW
jgi:hypothetical protein